MTAKTTHQNILLSPQDNDRLANLCGLLDENLRQIESYMNVEISNRGNAFRIKGDENNVPLTSDLIEKLYKISAHEELTPKQLHMYMNKTTNDITAKKDLDLDSENNEISIKVKKLTISPKCKSQELYIKGIFDNDLSFGVGSAGTGKTYLAVACAIYYLEKDLVKKNIFNTSSH